LPSLPIKSVSKSGVNCIRAPEAYFNGKSKSARLLPRGAFAPAAADAVRVAQ
jgi:hypothetical protein